MKLLAALRFLTTVPIPRRHEISAEEIGASLGYFPLVGLFLGAILAGINWLLSLILPSSIVNVIIIIALVLLTGALHIDGFIDTCDALFGRRTPQERWQIMSDSRVGSFGVVGAFCLLLLVYVSLGEIPEAYKMTALILMPALSRWSMVYAVFAFPYAKPAGLGKAFKEQASWSKLTLATLLVLASTLGLLIIKDLMLIFAGLALILMVWLIAAVLGLFLQRKFAGLTGDSYGAINEVSQVCILIFFCLISQ
ncbi:MAG: adenosylcobinamide-GDP ribazoletransferase [Dehalococcoidales bacterium]